MVGCLAVFVVLLLLAIVGGIWVANNWRNWMSMGVSVGIKQGIDESDLPREEKEQIKAEVDRVVTEFNAGRVSDEQAAMLVEKFMNSPLMATLVVSQAEQTYIDKSGLNEEERAEARITLRRFARGSVDNAIDRQSTDVAVSHIADKQADGNWQFRSQVTDEELRAFLKDAKKAADDAKIPEQPEEIDPSDEVKRIIDETMHGPAEAPQVPGAPPNEPATTPGTDVKR